MCVEQFDTESLKEKINIVDYIKQYVKLKNNGKNYLGLCPFHKEDTPSFAVNEDGQYCHCFGCGITYDVIGFAQEYHHVSFKQAVLGLYGFIGEDASRLVVPNVMAMIKEFTPKHKKVIPFERWTLQETCFDGITFEPIQEWIDEGITQEVLVAHKVGYDLVSNSIAFPIYDSIGNIIAIKHRTLDPDFKKKLIPKYIYNVPIGILDTFYWYYQNIEHIYDSNEIIIVESEKSVMKLESWGVKNAVASMTSNVSPEQLELLLKTDGVRDIVVAFDNDKSMDHVIKTFLPLRSYKNFYIVRDWAGTDALLGVKDSPCDKGYEVWKELYENKERIRKW